MHHFVLPMESGSDVASQAWRQQRDVSSTRRHNIQLITSPSRRICIDDGSASLLTSAHARSPYDVTSPPLTPVSPLSIDTARFPAASVVRIVFRTANGAQYSQTELLWQRAKRFMDRQRLERVHISLSLLISQLLRRVSVLFEYYKIFPL